MGRPIKPKPINPTEGFTVPPVCDLYVRPVSAILVRNEQIYADKS
jgi:hypothetical protein